MPSQTKKIFIMLIFLFVLSFTLFSGCKSSDTREKVDDTAEELAGKKQVDQMKKMEKDIGNITNKQSGRMDEADKTEPDEE